MNHYKLLTVTHKSVPLAQLGQYYIRGNENPAVAEQALRGLRDAFAFGELFYLQTCNRVLFLFTDTQERDASFLATFFQHANPMMPETALYRSDEVVQYFQGSDAVRHLHEVAASLDSLVIGEREILGQLREAYERCRQAGLTGDDLRLLFKFAIPAAKRIYTHTRIAEKPVSVVSLAARRLKEANLSPDARLVLVGAGQTMQLMAKFLRGMGFQRFQVFNRSLENAESLANTLGGQAADLEAMATYTGGFDALITCTGAADPIITPALYKQWNGDENHTKMIIDLAIPGDVHPAIPAQGNVHYVGMDQLRLSAEQNLAFRRKEMIAAKALVDTQVEEFAHALRRRKLERAMNSLPVDVRRMRERAVNDVFGNEVASLDPTAKATLDRVLDYMEKKFVALPMKAARGALLPEGPSQPAPRKLRQVE